MASTRLRYKLLDSHICWNNKAGIQLCKTSPNSILNRILTSAIIQAIATKREKDNEKSTSTQVRLLESREIDPTYFYLSYITNAISLERMIRNIPVLNVLIAKMNTPFADILKSIRKFGVLEE